MYLCFLKSENIMQILIYIETLFFIEIYYVVEVCIFFYRTCFGYLNEKNSMFELFVIMN